MNEKHEVYDEVLFSAMHQLGTGFDETRWRLGHWRASHAERELFLSAEVENPLFIYERQEQLPTYQADVEVFEKLLETVSVPEVVRNLYRRRFKRTKARCALIAASVRGDDEDFYTQSVKVHGKPQKRLFAYVAKRVVELSGERQERHPDAAKRLHKVFSKIEVEGMMLPDPGVLPEYEVEKEPVGSINEAVGIFQEALTRYGATDWAVEVDETGSRRIFAVNVQQRLVRLPAAEQLFARVRKASETHLRALAEHEVGAHVRRVVEAEKGPLKLLTVGLDRYYPGEEGVATYLQQQAEGANEFYGFDRYLAICLAVGLDGQPRDFRGTFSIMKDYYTIKLNDSGNDSDDYSRSVREAWDVCVRIFRGTTGQTAGCVYTKDLAYLEGNVGVWDLLIKRPHVFEHLFVGKYNPLITEHVESLQELEIMPSW